MTVEKMITELNKYEPFREVRIDAIFPCNDHTSEARIVATTSYGAVVIRDYYMQRNGDVAITVDGLDYEVVRR